MLLDQFLNFHNLLRLEAEVHRQLDDWINPELCLAVSMLNMNVRSPFLTTKEVEPKPFDSEDRRTHAAQRNLAPEGTRGHGEKAR